MSFSNIKAALESHLVNMVTTADISWENDLAEVSYPYIQANMIPAVNTKLTLAHQGGDMQSGIFQLTVIDQVGTQQQPYAHVTEITDHFPIGILLTFGGVDVKITKTVVNTSQIDNDQFVVPVSVYYQSVN